MDKKLTHTLSPRKSVAKIQVQGKFKEAGGPRTVAFCPNEKTTKCEG